MASLEEVISQMSAEEYLHDTIQFIIDSDLRIVSIPERGVVAGVVGDKNVNRINFQMERYYNGFDMSKFVTRINYVNAGGALNYYSVTDLTIEDNLIYFTWLVDSDVVTYSGAVMFAVNMFISDSNGKISQAFNTSNKGRLTVLEGIQVNEYVTPEEQEDLLTRLEADLVTYMEAQKQSAKNEIMSYTKNDAVSAFDKTAANITQINVKKVTDQGNAECEKVTQRGNAMISELKKKIYITDSTNQKTYVGEIKIISGKPVLEYEETIV